MLAFLRKNQVPLSSCFCLLLSIYILTAGARGQLRKEPLGAVLLWIMRPLQIASQGPLIGSTIFGKITTRWRDFKAENERLENGSKTWSGKAETFGGRGDQSRLQQLLDLRSHLSGTGLSPRSIIANSADQLVSELSARQRQRRRRAQGMAVVTPLGVVGQVVVRHPRTAEVFF